MSLDWLSVRGDMAIAQFAAGQGAVLAPMYVTREPSRSGNFVTPVKKFPPQANASHRPGARQLKGKEPCS